MEHLNLTQQIAASIEAAGLCFFIQGIIWRFPYIWVTEFGNKAFWKEAKDA